MSKYLPLFWDKRQIPALSYRVYINVFSIFLRIPLLPLSIDKTSIDFYYRGDSIFWIWKKKKWISLSFEAEYNNLKEIRKEWEDYAKYE